MQDRLDQGFSIEHSDSYLLLESSRKYQRFHLTGREHHLPIQMQAVWVKDAKGSMHTYSPFIRHLSSACSSSSKIRLNSGGEGTGLMRTSTHPLPLAQVLYFPYLQKNGGGRAPAMRAHFSARGKSLLPYRITSLLLFQGFAVGAKKPIGKSREVRSPAGELKITGIELTATLAVAMSPCEPPGIVSEIFG